MDQRKIGTLPLQLGIHLLVMVIHYLDLTSDIETIVFVFITVFCQLRFLNCSLGMSVLYAQVTLEHEVKMVLAVRPFLLNIFSLFVIGNHLSPKLVDSI